MKWIIISGVVIAVSVFILSNINKGKEDTSETINQEKYFSKQQVLTETEVKFYNALMQATKDMDIVIYPVMSLKELVYVVDEKGQKNPYKYFNKINKKHIDFTICEQSTTKILGCIELDDYTHQRDNRKERDQYVNQVLEQAGIKLLRYKVYKNYDLDYLRKKVEELLTQNPNTQNS